MYSLSPTPLAQRSLRMPKADLNVLFSRMAFSFPIRTATSTRKIAPFTLTVDHTVRGQDVHHRCGRRRQRQAEGAQQRAADGHLAVRELVQQRPDEQAGEVHHHVQRRHDDGCPGSAHLQVAQQVAEQQAERRLDGACSELCAW